MDESGERREPVVTGLADIDPVMPLSVGMLLVIVTIVGGFFTSGALPWAISPLSEGATTLTVLLFIGALLGWVFIGYGLLVIAAKVDAIYDMLRARDSDH